MNSYRRRNHRDRLDLDTKIEIAGIPHSYDQAVKAVLKKYPKTRKAFAHRMISYFFRTGRHYGTGAGPVRPIRRKTTGE